MSVSPLIPGICQSSALTTGPGRYYLYTHSYHLGGLLQLLVCVSVVTITCVSISTLNHELNIYIINPHRKGSMRRRFMVVCLSVCSFVPSYCQEHQLYLVFDIYKMNMLLSIKTVVPEI